MAEDGLEDWSGWEEACRREAAIRDLLRRYPKRLKINVVEEVAWELGLSRATTLVQGSTVGGRVLAG